MTDNELKEILKEKIVQDHCYDKEIQDILLAYKNSGGQQETAIKLVEQLAVDFSNDYDLQNGVYHIHDIVTGWCNLNMRVWDETKFESLNDGLQFEIDTEGVVFNHLSFCEILKHTMVKYGNIDYDVANEKLNNSYFRRVPKTFNNIEFITGELEFHWAMFLVHGNMYWIKGIPSNTNNFHDEYYSWRTQLKLQYNLKEPYTYYTKQ